MLTVTPLVHPEEDPLAELIPILGGALVGALAAGLAGGRTRWALGLLGCLLVGVAAAFVSGELARSAAFLLIDVPLAMLAGLAGGATFAVLARRHAQTER